MSDLETVRQELLERGDEMVSFRQLVERFDEVEKVFGNTPWNLMQIYNNFNILIGEKPNKWIPVSEKLPKPYTWVYATCKSLVDDRENWVIDTCYMPLPKEYNSKYSDWGNISILNLGRAEVIAWMEWIIPEPYKASPTGAERSDKE